MPKLLFASMLLALLSCKNKHAALGGNSPVELTEFLNAFPELSLPYTVADTNAAKKADTTTISYSVFTEFIPDTILADEFGKKSSEVSIRPLGKIEKENELYLLATITVNKKVTLTAFVFDKKNKFLSHLRLLKQGGNDNYIHSVSITTEPTFIITREKHSPNNDLLYTRNGYAYNNGSSDFIEVLNDSNEDIERANAIINPIDTFPRKNKYSGDYTKDKRNFISVRDGNTATRYIFFIHFEKDKGECTGELKGAMTMRDATHAYYQQSGDPCEIDFIFSSATIKVKERGNCGNRRGMRCFFDDTYTKKKEKKSGTTK